MTTEALRPLQLTANPPLFARTAASEAPKASPVSKINGTHATPDIAPAAVPVPTSEPTPEPAPEPTPSAKTMPELTSPEPAAEEPAAEELKAEELKAEEPAAAEPSAPTPPPRKSDEVRLEIESLKYYEVLKPIPVIVRPLGERTFEAEVPELNISTTGSSIMGVFLSMKSQIVSIVDRYRGKKTLSTEEQRHLAAFEQYIGGARRHWYAR